MDLTGQCLSKGTLSVLSAKEKDMTQALKLSSVLNAKDLAMSTLMLEELSAQTAKAKEYLILENAKHAMA